MVKGFHSLMRPPHRHRGEHGTTIPYTRTVASAAIETIAAEATVRRAETGSMLRAPGTDAVQAGLNRGMAYCSSSSTGSKVTVTGIPISTSSGAHPTILLMIRGPSANST